MSGPSPSPTPFDFGNGLGVNVSLDASAFDTPTKIAASTEFLARIAAEGIDWVRLTILHTNHDFPGKDALAEGWGSLQNGDGIDAMFAALKSVGLRAVVLCSAPQYRFSTEIAYANPEYFVMPHAGSDVWDRYAAFFAKVAARHNQDGRHIWECRNEPNLAGFANPAPDLEGYLYGLERFGAAVKAATVSEAQPEGAYVLGMTTSLLPLDWFARFAEHPAAQVTDAVGPHPYTDNQAGAGGFGVGRGHGPLFGPISPDPDPDRGEPRTAIDGLNAVRAMLRTAGRDGRPIELVSGEWGQSEGYTPPALTDEMVPAYTETFDAAKQLLKGLDTFAPNVREATDGPNWLTVPEPLPGMDVGDPDPSPIVIVHDGRHGVRFDGKRRLYPYLGYWAGLIYQVPTASVVSEWPLNAQTGAWYGFRFWARTTGVTTFEGETEIFAGDLSARQGFRLTSDWKEYRGTFNPGTFHWWGPDTSRPFLIGAARPGDGFEVVGIQVWPLSDGQVASAKELEQGRLSAEIARAAKGARCPLHLHYRWEDLKVDDDPPGSNTGRGLIEGRYGIVRENGTRKPALYGLRRGWDAVPNFDPLTLGSERLAAWYDASDPSTRFKGDTGSDAARIGDPLGRLEDLSGHGRHLKRAGADSLRPTLAASGSRAKAVFDGVNDLLLASTTYSTGDAGFAIDQPFLIGVWSVDAGGVDYGNAIGLWTQVSLPLLAMRNRPGALLNVQTRRPDEYHTDRDFAAARGTVPALGSVSNLAAGGLVSAGGFGASRPILHQSADTVLALGMNPDGAGGGTPLHLGELLVLDGLPDLRTLERLVRYLEAKWSL